MHNNYLKENNPLLTDHAVVANQFISYVTNLAMDILNDNPENSMSYSNRVDNSDFHFSDIIFMTHVRGSCDT